MRDSVIIVLLIGLFGCGAPTEKPYKTWIESNETTEASKLEKNEMGLRSSYKVWINDGLRIYTDTVYEVDHADTLISHNFLKHLHPGVAQFYGNDTTESSGTRYYEELYLQIDNESVFTEQVVQKYAEAIDSAYDYYMKNCDERGDIGAGIANRKLNTIVKTYLYEKIQNWDKAHELLMAESQLEVSPHLNLHSIAIPVLYEKYGKHTLLTEAKIISTTETIQIIHGIRFDLKKIRRRFRDKEMNWESYFVLAFEHYEKYGLD
jgi:hypothetical protein